MGLFGATFSFLYAFRNEGIFHLDAIFLAQAVERMYAGAPWPATWRFGAVLANAVVYFPFWLSGENAERSTIVASMLFDAASIAMSFLFIERLSRSRLLAALSAGLLAVAPVYSIGNTFGKEYGLAMLLLTTSFYLALRARETGSATRAAASALCFALSFIVWEGLLAVTPIYAMVLLAPRLQPLRRGRRARRVVAGGAIGFGAGVAFDLSTSLGVTLRTYARNANMTGFLGIASPVLPVAAGDLARWLGWPWLLTSVLGVFVALRYRRYRAILPLASLLIATLGFYGNLSTYGPRYLVLCAFGLSLLAGAGLHFMLGRGRMLQAAAIAAYVGSIGWMVAASYPMLAARHRYNGAKRFAALIAELTEPASVIIVMDDSRFVEYYAHRVTLQHPIGDAAATAAWIETVKREIERRPVYLTESGLSYDPGQLVQNAIDANFTKDLVGTRLSEDYHHAEGRLQLYRAHLWRLSVR